VVHFDVFIWEQRVRPFFRLDTICSCPNYFSVKTQCFMTLESPYTITLTALGKIRARTKPGYHLFLT